ncbi:hypothetical protein CC79DRAFT_809895 [Sarocladium strictum]
MTCLRHGDDANTRYDSGLLHHVVGSSLQAANFQDEDTMDYERLQRYSTATAYVRDVADMLVSASDALMLISLALLDRAISTLQTGGSPSRGSKLIVRLASAVALLLAIMAVICWGIKLTLHLKTSNLENGLQFRDLWVMQDTVEVVTFMYFLCLSGMVWILVGRFFAVMRPAAAPTGTCIVSIGLEPLVVALECALLTFDSKAVYFFFVATGFFALRSTYLLGRWAHLVSSMVTDASGGLFDKILIVLDPIFGTLPILGTMIVLVHLGRRKEGGIWITDDGEPLMESYKTEVAHLEGSSSAA